LRTGGERAWRAEDLDALLGGKLCQRGGVERPSLRRQLIASGPLARGTEEALEPAWAVDQKPAGGLRSTR
jgi:hypothetical protein